MGYGWTRMLPHTQDDRAAPPGQAREGKTSMRDSKFIRILSAVGLAGAIALGGVACADDEGTTTDTEGVTGGDTTTGGTTTGGTTGPSPTITPDS